jgi:hypothetical protein
MRKAALILILFAASTNAVAEMVLVSSDDIKTVYADQASIIKHGNSVEMDGLFDFKDVHTSDANKTYKSLKFRDEYNCDENQKRNLEISVHAENMAEGEVINSYSDPSKWQAVMGVGESLLKIACGVK